MEISRLTKWLTSPQLVIELANHEVGALSKDLTNRNMDSPPLSIDQYVRDIVQNTSILVVVANDVGSPPRSYEWL